MKRYFKYSFIITLFISSISLFSGSTAEKHRETFILSKDIQQELEDTVPRFPVKKTQITNYKDLKDNPPADLKDPSNLQNIIEFDPVTRSYIFRSKIGDMEISTPYSLTTDEYSKYTLKKSMSDYFKNKNSESFLNQDKKEEFSLKDIKLNIGPAERLFGPGGVQVRANGYVEATMGLKYTKTDNPTLSERNRSKTAFEFKEDIQMNVSASVGDKINFDMNYDTKALFDFDSKKLKLGYEGKEDEIIKRIEAGNVSMTTTNSLINGGTALFGINAELQFGKLRVNTVVSQQESQSQTTNSKGGIQTKEYEIKADQYDENRHFFLGYYFRDNYDNAMSKLPYIQSPVNITRIEVWITNKRSDYTQSRNIVAFADLGERDEIKNKDRWIADMSKPNTPNNEANNLYSTMVNSYSAARDISQITGLFNGYIESGMDYEKIESARLLTSSDYTFNPQLGYISLTSPLQSDEVLAVAYEYNMRGMTYQVGEFSSNIATNDGTETGETTQVKSGALFVKLLKPVSLSPRSYTWDLMMKNVYRISDYAVQQDRFRLNISFQSDTLGTYINYLPEGNIKNQLLLQVMNLDRLDQRNNEIPGGKGDGIFDFVEGYTIKSQTGTIIFPVVEPFGSHLKKRIGNEEIAKKYIYQELYDSTLTVARQIAEKNKFKIYGSYRGSGTSSSEIDLNTTNIPQGSVRLTAAGQTLTEGVDYIVDYISGKVTIINQGLLDSNTPIQVSSEGRTFSMQRKTMLGLNLSYDITKNFNIGGTVMHMYEKPLTTKTEFGNESVKNTLWGLNTSFKTESMWLTNLVDKIPFVNATQASQINFNAEFAYMNGGHYENKEAGGYSYLDDFETAESRIDLKNPYSWTLASTPFEKFEEASKNNNIDYGKNRARLAWFSIDGLFTRKGSSLTPSHITPEDLSNHFVREIYINEIYPNKDVAHNESSTISALNLSYYPEERGPYNLDATNISSDGKLLTPKKRWGGMTRKMDVPDFESTNIEYIEFWLMDPFVYDNTVDGGELYINLGEISEDVLKDGKKFYENGLPTNNDPDAVEWTVWGKVPKRQSTVYAFDDNSKENRKKQDVGLNGLSTTEEFEYETYANYLTELTSKITDPVALERMRQDPFSPFNDPAGDNYHFYRGSDYDEKNTSILDRYKYYNNTEGNSPATDETSEKYSTAARSVPDVEDINQDNTLNETEAYFNYKIDLKPGRMNVGDNYIVDKRTLTVPLRDGTPGEITWYQFKVPVRQYTNKVGSIQDFKSIRFMRMFLTDFKDETFLRFGTLQLVRGDWRIYEQTLNKDDNPSGNGAIDISTVNIEENAERTPVNYVLPPGLSRVIDPQQSQLLKENEQSLSIRVNDLDAGDARAVYKNTYYDMRRYKRLQLFTHAEELINGTTLSKGDLTVFIRLGSDYKNNYYEYEIPLTITPAGSYNNTSHRSIVWPADNMFDISLDLLKDIKLHRNKEKRKAGSTVSYTSIYSEYDPEKPNNKVSVKGNPSLSEVNVIMIGVRNNTRVTKSGEIWVNELRLTDFDEENGWAAQGNLNIALSDLATISLSGRKETAGFGALDQKLMERRSDDFQTYSIAASIELGRFLPEKAKVSLPVYYSYSNQTTTPKYDPFDQDVKLSESLSVVETKFEKDSIKSLAQDKTTNKSISINNVRVNIQSKTPMPYDPANFSFGYSFSESETKNPTTVYDLTKNYKATFNYTYSPLVKTWKPFEKTKSNSGSAKFAKSLGFNYLPTNISFNSNITRYYTETALRDIESYQLGEANNSNQFLSWSQSFLWDRDFNLNWDFTQNLKTSFQSGTRAEIEEPYLQVNKKLNRDDYEIWRDSVIRSIKNLGTPLEYRQIAKITYQLPFKNIPVMDWVNSNASYTSGYQWDRGARIDSVEVGNTIRNNITFELQNKFNLTNLYNKWGYLREVNNRFDGKRRPQSPSQRQSEKEQKEPERKRFTQKISLREDTVIAVTHGLKTKNIEVIARKDGKLYPVKFKKKDDNTITITNKDSVHIELIVQNKYKVSNPSKILKDIADYTARGLMSIRSFEFNYSKRNETYIAGFKPGIGDAFGQKNSEYGLSPGLGFAFGFDGGEDFVEKSLSRDWLVINDMNITPAVYNSSQKFEFKAQLEPIRNLKIELKANHEKNKRNEIQYMFEGSPQTFGGSFSMTTVAIGTSLRSSNSSNNYKSEAFEQFRKNRYTIKNRLEAQYSGTRYPGGGFMSEGTNTGLINQPYSPVNGEVDINSPDVLIPAFISAYTGKNAKSISLSAFPSLLSILPNWSLSYDGLTNIPFFKEKFKSIRINHSYTCLYQVGSFSSFSNWLSTGQDDLGYIRDILNGNPVPSSPYNISSVNISESFNPLFGIDGTLNNNMTINAKYNNSRGLTLNMSAYQIIEYLQKEFVLGFGYRINEFNRLIGLTDKSTKQFNNDLNIKVDLSHKTDEALLRKIEENFTQATNGTVIVTLKMSAEYTLSRSLTLRAFFDRILNKPLVSSTTYPTTNSNFGISLRFNLMQ